MHGFCVYRFDEDERIKGEFKSGLLQVHVGDVVLSLTEPQAREVLDTLIDLVSESRGQGMAA